MKSPLTMSRTSGRRNIWAVPVFWSKPFGAIRTGFGNGRLVRCGFVFKAAVIEGADAGGATKVIPKKD